MRSPDETRCSRSGPSPKRRLDRSARRVWRIEPVLMMHWKTGHLNGDSHLLDPVSTASIPSPFLGGDVSSLSLVGVVFASIGPAVLDQRQAKVQAVGRPMSISSSTFAGRPGEGPDRQRAL